MLLVLVLIDIALEPLLFKVLTISLLKSIKTSSTILITLSSVTLKPFIKSVCIFFLSNSLFILTIAQQWVIMKQTKVKTN